MGSPLVSIITPVLNRADTIRACLRSVSAQTHPNLEHIVVDGGSTDGTVQIIESFQSNHALTWISEPDDGMYGAINKGLRLAKGAVVAYLNSDDVYLPWSVEVAEAHLASGVDLVYGDMGILKRGRRIFLPQFYEPFDLNYYTHFTTIGQPTVFWRSDMTSHIGYFDTSYQLIGDCEYWLRAAVAGHSLAHVDEILAIQVEHGGTLRNRRREELQDEFVRLRSSYEDVAGPPARHATRFIARGLRWRAEQIRFGISSGMASPSKWPRFLGFLRSHGIQVSRRSLMWFMLPGRFWPRDLSTVDVDELEASLLLE